MANVRASDIVAGDQIYLGTLRHYEITKVTHYAGGRVGIDYKIPDIPQTFYDSVYQNRMFKVLELPPW